jgi:hypothetical protein
MFSTPGKRYEGFVIKSVDLFGARGYYQLLEIVSRLLKASW